MDLNFLGRGSAFNFKEGNTSAFFVENDELFLIDCGESIFKAIMENNILDGINKINILITHTHSDHVGSLGSLLTYTYYTLKQKVNIITKDDNTNTSSIQQVLNSFGCPKDSYDLVTESNFDNKYKTFRSIRFIKTTHSEELNCFSIIFETPCGIIYYSGDSKDEEVITSLLTQEDKIDKLYIDVTDDLYSANVHLHIDRLNSITPPQIRKKIYCMHFNNDECLKKASDYGFNIVDVINKKSEKVYTK